MNPFIIAELGSNFKNFNDCKEAISHAATAGADAIKFQLFNHQDLYGWPKEDWPGRSYELQESWIPKLKEKADACKIEFMCTAFSVEGLKIVDPYVSRHKIASSDCNYFELIEAAFATNKPVIVSNGGHFTKDIQLLLSACVSLKDRLTLLYCISAYPSRYFDLRRFGVFQSEFEGIDVGLSDHTIDVYNIPRIATQMGAKVIEKHFNPFRYTDTPDHPHSLTSDELKAMVQSIRDPLKIEAAPYEETDMVLRHNRRLIAIKDIEVGDELQYGENCGVYRSKENDTVGMHPIFSSQISGRKAKLSLKQGDPISPAHVDQH